jgi:hypothetical protein
MDTERILIARGITSPPWLDGIDVELEITDEKTARVVLNQSRSQLSILGLSIEEASELADALHVAWHLARSRKL